MYITLYTYRYTTTPGLIHVHWEMADNTRLLEVKHVFNYYDHMDIFDSCACEHLSLSEEGMEEIMTLMNAEGSIVKEKEFQRVFPLLEEAIVKVDAPQRVVIESSNVLGYVTMFNQKWFLPMFKSTTLDCKPVSNHLSGVSLLRWYEDNIQQNSMMDHDKLIWDRCEALIAKHTHVAQTNVTQTNVAQTNVAHAEETNAVDAYLMLYLEPSKKDVQLSEVYQDYKTRTPSSEITQAAFIKQLRTHSRFTIVRHACGMVIKEYTITRSYRFIHYVPTISSTMMKNHMMVAKQCNDTFPTSVIPYEREAFFLLSITMNCTPTNSMIQFFIADSKSEQVLKDCKTYLTLLEKYDAMCHDDLNDMSYHHRQLLQTPLLIMTYAFPFSTSILNATILDKKLKNDDLNDSTALNQYMYE